MATHRFTLFVDGPDLQDGTNVIALFDAGCDDATIGRAGSIQFLEFDREAASLADAVFDATRAVESGVPGVRVVSSTRTNS